MKKYFLISLILWSCNTSGLRNNDAIKLVIDKMSLTNCYLEIKTDENGIIDTTMYISEKRDNQDKLRYNLFKSNLNGQAYISETYYDENELDFLTKSNSDFFKERSEIIYYTNSDIKKLISTTEYDGEIDTLILNYEYDKYENGKVKTLQMTSSDQESTHIINYNKKEKKISEYIMVEKDTFELKLLLYENDMLRKIVKDKFSMDTTQTIQYFSGDEINDSTIVYQISNNEKKPIKKSYYTHEGKLHTNTTVVNLIDSSINKYKRIKKVCD